jgi:hypothetical protein
MRAIAACAAASDGPRAANSTRSRAGCIIPTSTGSPSIRSSRWSAAPRRRIRPSIEPPPSRNGHGGRTSTRSSAI